MFLNQKQKTIKEYRFGVNKKGMDQYIPKPSLNRRDLFYPSPLTRGEWFYKVKSRGV
jgi:hypothetical protein